MWSKRMIKTGLDYTGIGIKLRNYIPQTSNGRMNISNENA